MCDANWLTIIMNIYIYIALLAGDCVSCDEDFSVSITLLLHHQSIYTTSSYYQSV